MSIDEEEIRAYLEGKKLRNINLPQDSNTIDQGKANAKEVKIGQKSSSLARVEYIQERHRKILAGDKLAAAEFMAQQTEINNRLEAQREKSRLEYELARDEDRLKKKLSKITEEDRQSEKDDIEKIERKREAECNNVLDYFNASEEFWNTWQSDGHTAEESPAAILIARTDYGYCCRLHRYKNHACSAFVIGPVESHFRDYEPEEHKQAIINSIDEKYSKLIEARKEKTLENKEVAFKRELRDIDSIKTRPGGDYGLLNSGTKITKGQKARIRELEEKENEKNRRIYRGLY